MPSGVDTQIPRDELDNLICERLWVEKKMHERLVALVLQHSMKHRRLPNVVFLSGRFERWFRIRGVHRLDVEAEQGDVPICEAMLICCGPADVELGVGYKEGHEFTRLSAMLNVEGLRTFLTEDDGIKSIW